MKLKTKMIIGLIFVVIALVVIPLLITSILRGDTNGLSSLNPIELSTPTEITTSTFIFDEGYSIELPNNWSLTDRSPDRSVDRYRFIRLGESGPVVSASIYEGVYATFEEVIEARYGTGFIDQVEDLDVNGLTAKRLTSSFLDAGNSVDLIIQLGPIDFISLYGVKIPEGEQAFQVVNEINTLQMSFKQ